jgi:hypothetical protein
MATVINNPGESESSGVGLIIGVIVAIILIALFFIYALPAMRGSNQAPANPNIDLDVSLPGNSGGSGGAGTGGTGGGTGTSY